MNGRNQRPMNLRILRPSARLMLVLYTGVATVLGVLFGWLVIQEVQWHELGDALTTANIPLIFLAWAVMIAGGYLRGIRWRILLNNPDTSASRLFLIEQTGTALDTLSPVRVLDEIVEVGILTLRDRLQLGAILATLALQRTFEFGTTVLLLGGGALLLAPFRPFWPYLTAGIAFGGVSLLLLFTIGPALQRVPVLSKVDIIPQFASAVMLLRRDKWRSGLAFCLSIAQAVFIGIVGWMVAIATRIDVGLPAMIVITLGVMFFSSTVPGLPMALGTFEFGVVSLLGLWGIGTEQAIAFSLMLHAVLFVPPIIFAAFFLPKEGLMSLKELKRLTEKTRAEMATAQRK
jgi:uncharacterized membrane protein YbhN (UPF0104 family)